METYTVDEYYAALKALMGKEPLTSLEEGNLASFKAKARLDIKHQVLNEQPRKHTMEGKRVRFHMRKCLPTDMQVDDLPVQLSKTPFKAKDIDPDVARFFGFKMRKMANSEETLPEMRKFASGATRNTDENKLDYEAFLSGPVLRFYAEYMHQQQYQADGKLREGDNWQKGIPLDVYMKSMWRHFMDVWLFHRGLKGRDTMKQALGGLLFNVMGYTHEYLKLELTKQTDKCPALAKCGNEHCPLIKDDSFKPKFDLYGTPRCFACKV
jgi:hypothetical protein